jgi:hypothetical protein
MKSSRRFSAFISLAMLGHTAAWPVLSPCKFNFGAAWQGPNHAYPAQIDYVTIWAGDDESWNAYWIGALLAACKPGGKLAGRTPVYYSYIIAFTARNDLGLKDCNVGTPNLCQKGANYIRQKKDRILSQYAKYASETAKAWGTQEPIVWMMEPDYFQYFSDKSQEGGPLSYAEAGALMGEITETIRKSLPNAIFSLDISPWIPDPAKWYGSFKLEDFAYMNTSGGDTEAGDARIRKANSMTWKSVHELTRKPILADDGYGVAGSSTGHDATWDAAANLNARIGDGVVAISQANPKPEWNAAITGARPLLVAVPCASLIRSNRFPPLQYGSAGEYSIMRDALGRLQEDLPERRIGWFGPDVPESPAYLRKFRITP